MDVNQTNQTLIHELGNAIGDVKYGKKAPVYANPTDDWGTAIVDYVRSEGGLKNPQILEKYRHHVPWIDDALSVDPGEREKIFQDFKAKLLSEQHATVIASGASVTILTRANMLIIGAPEPDPD